jgi:hypothetical protein
MSILRPTGKSTRPSTAMRSSRSLSTEDADGFRRGWDALQTGFVDDPRQAVQDADELVDRVLRSLRESLAAERSRLKAQVAQANPLPTEDLRMTLRRYRSFFHRLLSL